MYEAVRLKHLPSTSFPKRRLLTYDKEGARSEQKGHGANIAPLSPLPGDSVAMAQSGQ